MQSTRNKLIGLLAQNKHKYISGQLLAEQLNISRSAVWKHMKDLEKDGYHIEAKSRLGYRIVEAPDKVSENTLKWGLKTKWLGQRIIHKQSIPSTQTLAHELAQQGTQHGTVVIADEQTEGKGRMNRPWQSVSEKGIWLSMILKPSIPPFLAPQLTLLTATVLADVITAHTNIRPQIKWPNDILMNGKKVAGILTEMQAEQDRILYVVIGIGLNVNQTYDDLHKNIQQTATSLYCETDKEWDIKQLIHEMLLTFEKSYATYIEHGFPNVKNKWESYGFKIGEEINIKTLKGKWQATFLGIAEDGALLTKMPSGETKKIYSAEIDWFQEEEK